MNDNEGYKNRAIHQKIMISGTASKVWDALTNPELMKKWMSDLEIEITTNWQVGSPIFITGGSPETHFENKGIVLQFEPERILSYNHLSSLSALSDAPENFTVIAFELTPNKYHTTLELTLSNFPTEAIYKHFEFYWSVSLEVLKKFAEK